MHVLFAAMQRKKNRYRWLIERGREKREKRRKTDALLSGRCGNNGAFSLVRSLESYVFLLIVLSHLNHNKGVFFSSRQRKGGRQKVKEKTHTYIYIQMRQTHMHTLTAHCMNDKAKYRKINYNSIKPPKLFVHTRRKPVAPTQLNTLIINIFVCR